jgi:hypothetical protein
MIFENSQAGYSNPLTLLLLAADPSSTLTIHGKLAIHPGHRKQHLVWVITDNKHWPGLT